MHHNNRTFDSISGAYKYVGVILDQWGLITCPYYASSSFVYPTGYVPPSDTFGFPANLADLPTSNYNKYFNKF